MTEKLEYERIGRFIYSAHRYGGGMADVHNWMADDLGLARPVLGGEAVPVDLYSAFFAKYASEEAFRTNYERFVETMMAK